MRLAVLADIHGNLPALDGIPGPAKAVLGAVRFERRKPGAPGELVEPGGA